MRFLKFEELSVVSAKVGKEVCPIQIHLHLVRHLIEEHDVLLSVYGIVVIPVPNIQEIFFHFVVEFLFVPVAVIKLSHYSVK